MYQQLLKDQELIQNTETTIEQMLRQVTEQIMSDIDEVNGIDIHPLDPDDISLAKTKEIIPASLKQLLTLLCNRANQHKILSIAQNIIKLKSRARKQMAKHVGLGVSLKDSLRSKEFITLLNNLGHCISYDGFTH